MNTVYSGLLQIGKRFYQDSKNEKLLTFVRHLEKRVKSFYSKENPFGFQSIEKKEHEMRMLNEVGLIEGSVGAALSLLDLNGSDKFFWDFPFLIA